MDGANLEGQAGEVKRPQPSAFSLLQLESMATPYVSSPSVRLLIRTKLAAGILPTARIMNAWRGRGNGTRCNACAEVLTWNDVMVDGFTSSMTVFRFHIRCFEIWDDERQALR